MTNVGGSRRAAQALAALAATAPIGEAELDAAGIPHWRERLLDAAAKDEEEYGVRRGPNYDLTWRLLREELGRAPLPVPPAAPAARRSYPNRQERNYGDDDERF